MPQLSQYSRVMGELRVNKESEISDLPTSLSRRRSEECQVAG
jgi:hypothetical protein